MGALVVVVEVLVFADAHDLWVAVAGSSGLPGLGTALSVSGLPGMYRTLTSGRQG